MIEVQRAEAFSSIQARLRRAFRNRLPISLGTEERLTAALDETLRRPGNLIRAELAFKIATAYGLTDNEAEQLAVGLEYFHTASLIFDDLPSMDDATHRRGGVCIHRLYGEGTAILSALALINRAYLLLWKAIHDAPAADRVIAADFLETHLGLSGILNGQSRDIHFAHPGLSTQSPQQIALEKTASLIRLALVLPAMVAGAPQPERELLNRLAVLWGLGYQALDDLKDVLREEQQTGKTSGRDELLHRPNVVLELGAKNTLDRLRRLGILSERVTKRLKTLKPSLNFLDDVGGRFERETRALLNSEEAMCSS